MAVQSKRESILDYILATTLVLIDGTGHYNNNLKKITRRMKQLKDFDDTDLPAVMIRDDFDTEYSPLSSDGFYSTGSVESVTDGMGVGLIGMVAKGGNYIDTGKISEAANKLHSDMIIAMLSDSTLGGNCEAITLVSSRNSLDYAGHNGLAVCFQLYSVNYLFNPIADPPVT